MINLLIIFFAKYLYVIIVALAFGVFIPKRLRTKKNILFSVTVMALTLVLGKIASLLYYNPRPFVVNHFTPLIPHDATNGFPSDHGLLVFAVTVIIYFLNKKAGYIFFVLSLLVEAGRVLAGVHSVIDVLGSLLISIISLYIAKILIFKKHE